MRVVLLELIGQRKGHDRQTGIVVCARFVIPSEHWLAFLELKLTLGTVDVADTPEPTCRFEGFGEQARVSKRILHD